MTPFWHPFADMSAVRHGETVIDRADGVWLWTEDGRRLLDATASLWYMNVGHGRDEIVDAAARQARRLAAYSTFGDLANRPALDLAERLASVAPVEDPRVFLTSGGGDSIDTAAKVARQHFALRGRPQRQHLIARVGGYHGTHGFGTSLGGIEVNRSGYGTLLPAVSVVAHDDARALDAELQRLGPDTVAAFFAEPVIGAGGVLHPPPGYLQEVASICRDSGVLFVCDAVICGFGRLGTWFGIERFDVEPDMIVFAKGVTSGYLPLGGVVCSGEVAEPFWSEPGHLLRHGATYAGHPTCCAAALANLEILERERLLERSAAVEAQLEAALRPIERRSGVAEVRAGLGALAAVELAPELLAERPSAVVDTAAAARRRGVLVRPLARSLAVSPPLIVEPDEIGMIGAALDESVAEVAAVTASPLRA
jgi:putrescine aminotransferase